VSSLRLRACDSVCHADAVGRDARMIGLAYAYEQRRPPCPDREPQHGRQQSLQSAFCGGRRRKASSSTISP